MIKKIIKLIILFCFISVLIVTLLEINKNTPKAILQSLIKSGRLEGPKLNFVFSFMGVIPVGSAYIQDKGLTDYQGKKAYYILAKGETARYLSKFFSAKATLESFIDKDKLHSLVFRMHSEVINRPNEDKELIYDQKKNIMYGPKGDRVIYPNTQDPLSAIFYIRKQTLVAGEVFDLNLNTNQKNYSFKAKVLKKETFDIGGKKIGVWLLDASIRRQDKSPRHSSNLQIWLLDNPAKTPILIKIMTNVGPMVARLVKAGD